MSQINYNIYVGTRYITSMNGPIHDEEMDQFKRDILNNSEVDAYLGKGAYNSFDDVIWQESDWNTITIRLKPLRSEKPDALKSWERMRQS